jgi:HlyD family secretion protein
MMKATKAQSVHDKALHRATIFGTACILLFAGTIGLWAGTAPLSGAVIAPAQFVVDSYIKKVQHPSGGIVGELKVREGQRVAEGDMLIRLDETITRANLQIITNMIDELSTRRARLEAEISSSETVETPPELAARLSDPDLARMIESERRLFESRRSAREGQKSQLRKRITQLQDEITGLKAQQDAKVREASFITEELKGVRELYNKNLVQLPRLNALEREAASLEGQRGQLVAAVAQSEGRIAEINLQIIQIEEETRAEGMRELREIQSRLSEMSERRVAAEDQLKRIDIRSPSSGYVHQLNVHTVGGVIAPGEPLMFIVPIDESLNLEGRIFPQDVDQLTLGQKATVRVHASNQRTTPEIYGTLTRISADVSRDPQTGMAFYTIRVALPPEEVRRLGNVKLLAGMQADVYVQTSNRTPFQYFMKPLTDQFARAFREY